MSEIVTLEKSLRICPFHLADISPYVYPAASCGNLQCF